MTRINHPHLPEYGWDADVISLTSHALFKDGQQTSWFRIVVRIDGKDYVGNLGLSENRLVRE
tara:strand:+ start:1302 stop:1487 length:186 start_codon:yes stop_codon:yes gene_type:complete